MLPNNKTPKTWQEVSLGAVAAVNMGQSPSSLAYNVKGIGLPLIQGNNDVCDSYTIDRVWTSEVTKTAEKGEIILSVRAPVGQIALAHTKVCLGRGVCSIESKHKKFLWHFLKYFESKWGNLEQGSTFSAVNSSDIKNLKLNLPSSEEQKRIVEVLETWDRAIEKLAKKIEIKKKIKNGLMQDLVTGKNRLSGFKDRWETIKLEDIANFRRGSFPQPYGLDKWYDDLNGAPFVQVYDVDDNFKLKENTKRKISSAAQNMSVFVPKDSIVITIQGSIGRIAITNYDAYLDRTLLFFKSFKKPVNKVFFMYSVFLLFEIEKNKADGGTIKTITKESLNKFNIKIASIEEQTKVAEILTVADKEIVNLEKKLSIIKKQKRYLLNNLITGKIRTPENMEILDQVQDDINIVRD